MTNDKNAHRSTQKYSVRKKQRDIKTNFVVRLVCGLVTLWVSVISLMNYLEYSGAIENDNKIDYVLLKKGITTSSNGTEIYKITIAYRNKQHRVTITETDYYDMENGKMPGLYYSKDSDSLISEWEREQNLRMTYIFFILSVLLFLPYGKIFEQLKKWRDSSVTK